MPTDPIDVKVSVQGLIAFNISEVSPTCAQLPRSTFCKNHSNLAYVGAYASSNSRSVCGTRGAEAGDRGDFVGAARFLRSFWVWDVIVGEERSLEGEGTLGRADADGGETWVGFAGDTG